MSTKETPAGISAGGWRASTTAIAAAAKNEARHTLTGPIRSDRAPPSGRATTAAREKPAVRIPASVCAKS